MKYRKQRNRKIHRMLGILLIFGIVIGLALYIKWKFSDKDNKSKSAKQSSEDAAVWEKGYNLPIDEKESEQADQDCMKIAKEVEKAIGKGIGENANISDVEKTIIEVVDKEESPVLGTGIYDNLHNYKKMDTFIKNITAGKKGEIVIYEVHADKGFARKKFLFDGKDLYCLFTNLSWSDNEKSEPQITSSSYTRIKKWNYTDRGWFCYELCVPEPPEVTEVVNGNIMLRVHPFNEKYKEFAQKYLLPICYQGNNLLCSEWDKDHMSDLDYCGLFEYFYAMQKNCAMNQEQYLDGIPKNEFTDVITKYLPVTAEQLEQFAAYDQKNEKFFWARLGCLTYSPNPFGTSIPEVTEMTENEDGTICIKVDAVCEWYGTDQIFSHELTVRFKEDGNIEYLGNHILEPGLENLPAYQYRLKK